jgi:hypothetical protein
MCHLPACETPCLAYCHLPPRAVHLNLAGCIGLVLCCMPSVTNARVVPLPAPVCVSDVALLVHGVAGCAAAHTQLLGPDGV